MAEIDYNEILLEAIDAVVSSRLADVNFDRTIVATIVDASKAKDGEYVLSDGSVQFTAHSSSDKYRENDRVNVLIPSNDFSSTEKTILGKTSANVNDIPVTYVSPLEKIVPMETNYAAGLKGGITANSETERFQLTNVEWVTVNESTLGYDTLCVSARFKTLLNDYDIRQGHYGLLVQLRTKNGYIHALTLDSAKDMFGNPYGYSMYLTQEQTYHLNLQDNIVGIKIDLYQMKDFKYNDGVKSELQVLPVMPYSNILVDNINVSFGYNAEQVEDNTVKISTADSLTYDNIKDASVTKKLTLTWYNKDENNKYLGFADGAFDTLLAAQIAGDKKYYIKWEHSLNNGQWEELQKTGQEQELTVNLNMTWALNEYRAVIVYNGAEYFSNILQFKNATGIDNPQERLKMSLTLHNVEGSSQDSYAFYGADGTIINPYDANKARQVYFSYDSTIGGALEPDVLKGATAYFYIPEHATMLAQSNTATNWSDELDKAHAKTGYKAYVKRFGNEEITEELKTFSYCIQRYYNPLFTNNTLVLKIVDKNGFEYETSKTVNFSSYGTSGTDYSIIIGGAAGETGWVGNAAFTPQAQLYDANHKLVNDVSWKYYKYPKNTRLDSNNLSLAKQTSGYHAVKAETSVAWVGKTVNISGVYPISYQSNADYLYQGPVTIMYNSGGVNPSYYSGDLGLFNKYTGEEIPCSWSIEYYHKNSTDVLSDIDACLSWGQLVAEAGKPQRFKPSSMYIGDDYCLVLVAKSGSTTLWRQPLIILKNQYASSLLNNWDGELIVNNDENYILSAMMGAGTKNADNQFSGIVMGDVGKLDSDYSGQDHGLFGYRKGAQSFGFKTDGTAFIGEDGKGRIEFDGNLGVIQSSQWNGSIDRDSDSDTFGQLTPGDYGMAISLESGQIDAHDFKLTSSNLYLNSAPASNDYYFKIGNDNSNARISFSENGALDIKASTLDLATGIGGTNLLKMTSPSAGEIASDKFKSYWTYMQESSISAVKHEASDIETTITVSIDDGDQQKETLEQVVVIEPNKYYTLSGYLVNRKSSSEKLAVYIDDKQVIQNTVAGLKRQYFKYTFYNDNATSVKIGFKNETKHTFGIYHAQLEEGTIATAWSSAEEDTSVKISIAEEKISASVSTVNDNLTDLNTEFTSYQEQTAQGFKNIAVGMAGHFGICNTADGSYPKHVELANPDIFPSIIKTDSDTDGHLPDGTSLAVQFTYGNTTKGYFSMSTSKNSNSEEVWYRGSKTSATNYFLWDAEDVIFFVYADGHWNISETGTYSQIKQTAAGITSTVKSETDKLQSQIDQKPDSITLSVSNDAVGKTSGPSITLSYDIDGTTQTTTSAQIKLSGDVIFKNNLTDKTTVISGDNITTGTIDAKYIDAKNLTVKEAATISGTLTANKIVGGSLGKNNGLTIAGWNINDNSIYKDNTKIHSSGGAVHTMLNTNSGLAFQCGWYEQPKKSSSRIFTQFCNYTETSSSLVCNGSIPGATITEVNITQLPVSAENNGSAKIIYSGSSFYISQPVKWDGYGDRGYGGTWSCQVKYTIPKREYPRFGVTESGALFASSGVIGGWTIGPAGLYYKDPDSFYSITIAPDSLSITDKNNVTSSMTWLSLFRALQI